MHYRFEDFTIFDSPSEMLEVLQEIDCCKNALTKNFVHCCMELYSSCCEDEEREKEEAKEYIIYALV